MKSISIKMFFLVLLTGAMAILFGCAPGNQLVVRPDVFIGGDFRGPRCPYERGASCSSFYDYGLYFPYVTIVPVNGTPFELDVFVNGKHAEITLEDGTKANRIPPGMPAKISAFVDYRVSRQISVVLVAYKNNKVVGSASRLFHFYGSANTQQVINWPVRVWDFRDP